MSVNPCIVNTLGMTDEEVDYNIEVGLWERCPYCKCVFVWLKLPDENIRDYNDTIQQYYICPECGYKVNF